MKHIVLVFSLAVLLLINACKSSLSKGKVEGLSSIGVNIEVLQSLINKKDNSVKVQLFDDNGSAIANKDIQLKVNNISLDFMERQELYYTTTSEYVLSNIPVSEVYNFEIILTNGKSYFLGSVKPLAESNEKDIVCSEKGDFNKDFVIYWDNLNEISELSIMKSIFLNTSTKTEHNYGYDAVIEKRIEDSGQYLLPKSSYINSKSIISGLEIKFNALKMGAINPDLIEGSEIKISGHLDKTVDFDEFIQLK